MCVVLSVANPCLCFCVVCTRSVQIVLLAISRYFVGYIFTFREMDLMDSLIPSQLYPKCARKMRSGDGVMGQETVVLHSFTAAGTGEKLGKESHQEDVEVG